MEKDYENDDIGGMLCKPPGMSVKQVEEFNRKFLSMPEDERKDYFKVIYNALKDTGVKVYRLGEDDDEIVRDAVKELSKNITK